jgi:hypothetical protein
MSNDNNESAIDPDLIKELNNIQSMDDDKFKEWIGQKELDLPEAESIKKLIDCQHEIVFTITGNVLSQNDKGEIIGLKEMCKKNFHIPVPTNRDYKKYMRRFFEYLESNLLQTISDTNEKEENNE